MGLADDYRDQIINLQPRGRAWSRDITSTLAMFAHAIADSFARLHLRVLDLIAESDPRTTTELIDEWERAHNLPSPCITITQTLQERRNAVNGKNLGNGGHNIPYLVQLAADMGFTISIVDKVTAHHWEILVPGVEVTRLSTGVGPGHQTGEPLRTYGPEELLECVFMQDKHAHTVPTFTYGAAADYSVTKRDTDPV